MQGTGGERSSGSGGASTGGSVNRSEECRAYDLPLVNATGMYSAYIQGNSHLFQVPVLAIVPMGTAVQWRMSDPSAVRIDETTTSGLVVLTTRKAGDVTITADVGGRCASSTLHVAAATEEQWQSGNARYNNMNPLPKFATDAGIPVNFTDLVLEPPGHPPACTNCHGDMATNDTFRTTMSTPVVTTKYSDEELIDVFTKGATPMGGWFNPFIPVFVWSFFHTWSDLTPQQAQAMVVYLRSLPVDVGLRDAGSST